MAKGYFLTNEVKMLIAGIHSEHPDWGPTKVREELVSRLEETGLYRNFDKNWPGVSAVGNVLRPMRKRERELGPNPLDQPWRILSLASYDIPPGALPYVMGMQAMRIEQGSQLTIREAKWIARLYRFVETMIPKHKEKLGLDSLLWVHAIRYARSERVYELLRETGNLPDSEIEKWLLLYDDSLLYGQVTGDRKPFQRVCSKLHEIDPEAYRRMVADEDDGPPFEGQSEELEEMLKRKPEKEEQDERINKTKKQK